MFVLWRYCQASLLSSRFLKVGGLSALATRRWFRVRFAIAEKHYARLLRRRLGNDAANAVKLLILDLGLKPEVVGVKAKFIENGRDRRVVVHDQEHVIGLGFGEVVLDLIDLVRQLSVTRTLILNLIGGDSQLIGDIRSGCLGA